MYVTNMECGLCVCLYSRVYVVCVVAYVCIYVYMVCGWVWLLYRGCVWVCGSVVRVLGMLSVYAWWVELGVYGTQRCRHTNRTHVCLWALSVPLHVNACPSQRL